MDRFTSKVMLPRWQALPWITFAWTTPAVKAQRKTVTRRQWQDGYGNRFRTGDLMIAADRRKEFGGSPFGIIRLAQKPYKESETLMPEADFEGEGFAYLSEHPELKPKRWRDTNLRVLFDQSKRTGEVVWVIRFEVVELFDEVPKPPKAEKPSLQERLL